MTPRIPPPMAACPALGRGLSHYHVTVANVGRIKALPGRSEEAKRSCQSQRGLKKGWMEEVVLGGGEAGGPGGSRE